MIYSKPLTQQVACYEVDGTRIVSFVDHTGYAHLLCNCNKFWMVKNGQVPWCRHIKDLVDTGLDAEEVHRGGIANGGVAYSVYMKSQIFNVSVKVSDFDSSGFSRLFLPTHPKVMDIAIEYIGLLHTSAGRATIAEMVHERVTEWILEGRTFECLGYSHPISLSREFKFGVDFAGSKEDMAGIWSNIYSIIQEGRCRECATELLYNLDPDPYGKPF